MSNCNGQPNLASGDALPPLRKRVLIVDDSAFMRRLVTDVIAESGEFDVVGTARDGVHAMAQIQALDPDIVTMDIDMPGQDGLATLHQIMTTMPRPVVMLSAGGADGGADATLRALELGAVDFVRKPSGAISLDLDDVRDQLIDTLRAAACSNRDMLVYQSPVSIPTDMPATDMPAVAATLRASRAAGAGAALNGSARSDGLATSVVCIAASTGGPAALARVIPRLPRLSNTAVVIAQHMPPGFTKSLARRLGAGSMLVVREAVDGEPVRAGHVYLAPGGRHLRVVGTAGNARCAVGDDAPLWGVRPAADHLFASVVEVFGKNTVGVVLTGMGCDGAEGLFDVRHARGCGIVQDAESSVIAGMPMAALRHAGADYVLPIDAVADTVALVVDRLNNLTRHSEVT